ncbi:hypothetical protein SAMN04489712_104544 [Thermomonospora echinospora]|uniref:Uncharacterized protein n=1 Tax=Thermomonospora echinospora TaxID=1992 RepID=A0A1H5ZGJ8_9ACTN|nr:hypothetical protein SAMN04489712_104544 [Thermomonospora echinospora]
MGPGLSSARLSSVQALRLRGGGTLARWRTAGRGYVWAVPYERPWRSWWPHLRRRRASWARRADRWSRAGGTSPAEGVPSRSASARRRAAGDDRSTETLSSSRESGSRESGEPPWPPPLPGRAEDDSAAAMGLAGSGVAVGWGRSTVAVGSGRSGVAVDEDSGDVAVGPGGAIGASEGGSGAGEGARSAVSRRCMSSRPMRAAKGATSAAMIGFTSSCRRSDAARRVRTEAPAAGLQPLVSMRRDSPCLGAGTRTAGTPSVSVSVVWADSRLVRPRDRAGESHDRPGHDPCCHSPC